MSSIKQAVYNGLTETLSKGWLKKKEIYYESICVRAEQ